MNWKRVLQVVVAVAIVATVAAALFEGPEDHWTVEADSASNLVLSLKPLAKNSPPATLQIRCDGRNAEVRLYIPIRVAPPVGQATGPAVLRPGEEYLDRDRKPVVFAAGPAGPSEWTVAGAGYVARKEPLALIERLPATEWLYIRGVAFSGDDLVSTTIIFPVMGVVKHKTRVASTCRDAG